MPKVICTRPNASLNINGVDFTQLEDGSGIISEEIDDEAAELFTSIDGYRLATEEDEADADQKPAARAPAAKPAAKAPVAPAKPAAAKKAAPAPAPAAETPAVKPAEGGADDDKGEGSQDPALGADAGSKDDPAVF